MTMNVFRLLRLMLCAEMVCFILLAAWQIQRGQTAWLIVDVTLATVFLFMAMESNR